jgi:hypothetical protein
MVVVILGYFLCLVFGSYSSYLIGYLIDWFYFGQNVWLS